MNIKFKKEWDEDDFGAVRDALKNHLEGKIFRNHRGKFERLTDIYEVLGLPYTSTSSYAMQSMDCNVILYSNDFPAYYFDHVALSVDGEVVLCLMDSEECCMYIVIDK